MIVLYQMFLLKIFFSVCGLYAHSLDITFHRAETITATKTEEKKLANVDKAFENFEPFYSVDKKVKWCNHYRKQSKT